MEVSPLLSQIHLGVIKFVFMVLIRCQGDLAQGG